jgi:hypothetical protein
MVKQTTIKIVSALKQLQSSQSSPKDLNKDILNSYSSDEFDNYKQQNAQKKFHNKNQSTGKISKNKAMINSNISHTLDSTWNSKNSNASTISTKTYNSDVNMKLEDISNDIRYRILDEDKISETKNLIQFYESSSKILNSKNQILLETIREIKIINLLFTKMHEAMNKNNSNYREQVKSIIKFFKNNITAKNIYQEYWIEDLADSSNEKLFLAEYKEKIWPILNDLKSNQEKYLEVLKFTLHNEAQNNSMNQESSHKNSSYKKDTWHSEFNKQDSNSVVYNESTLAIKARMKEEEEFNKQDSNSVVYDESTLVIKARMKEEEEFNKQDSNSKNNFGEMTRSIRLNNETAHSDKNLWPFELIKEENIMIDTSPSKQDSFVYKKSQDNHSQNQKKTIVTKGPKATYQPTQLQNYPVTRQVPPVQLQNYPITRQVSPARFQNYPVIIDTGPSKQDSFVYKKSQDNHSQNQKKTIVTKGPKATYQPTQLQNYPVTRQVPPAQLQNYPVTRQVPPVQLQNYPITRQVSPARFQNYPVTRQVPPAQLQNYPVTRQVPPTQFRNYPVTRQISPTQLQNYHTGRPVPRKTYPNNLILY